ncbi:hypothetical protein ACET3X_008706 [Alternaria dauci]|uniref:Uncharacterized protein n=1 Tax=Alternaria dauci TaxID=48095 RepID=A0ABR3UD15_9PLEO
MLNTMIVKTKAPRKNANTTIPRIDIHQHYAKCKIDRENIARRQELSEEAQIKRFREKSAHQDKAAHIENQLPRYWTPGDKVSIQINMREDADAKKIQKQVAARIAVANKTIWETALVAVAKDNPIATSKTTSNSYSNLDKSSPEPESDKRSASRETAETSHYGSYYGDTAGKLSKLLVLLNGECMNLHDELNSTRQQLSEKHAEYEALEHKYAKQRGQRINDKQLVDHWAQEAADAEVHCEEVSDAKQALEIRLVDANEKHRVDLEAKDCEIETLKAEHDLVVKAKDVETEKWYQASLQKESTYQNKFAKLVAEREEIQAKAIREKRKIWKASRSKVDDLKESLEAWKTKYDQMSADSDDATAKNEETIISLVARNQQLELEYGAMRQVLQENCTRGSDLHLLSQIIEASTASKKESKDLRATVKRLEEHIENLLDIIQNLQNVCARHREAEQDMRAASKRAHDIVQLLEDKLALTKTQLRDATNQLEKIQQGAIPAGAHCTALDALEQENEDLREALQTERNDKMEIQAKLDKLDNENLGLSIEYDSIEAELIEHKKSSSTLRDSTEAAMHELNMLRKVVQGQQGALGEQDHHELLSLVSRTTEENRGLIESTARMEARVQEMEQHSATIEDKSESEVMKARDNSEFWFHLYYNEAVSTTELLHAEIAALKAEKGERHFVESAPPANPVVYDRKMLPCATMYGLAGIPAHLITSAVCDAEGVTHLSATMEALQMLRPLGWQPVAVAGKVWLSKVVKPLSENDAANQVQTSRHNGNMSGTGSGQSSMSNTYRPRNHPTTVSSMFYQGLPTDCSEMPTPSPMDTPNEQLRGFVIPERGDQVVARRETTRSTTKQTPEPKPRAAHRAAEAFAIDAPRAPEWQASWLKIDSRMTREAWEDEELDYDFKVNWIRLNVMKKGH